MATTHPLEFQLMEPGDDPLCDQIIEILRNTLQPDSKSALDVAVQQITSLLPEGKPYSSEVGRFLETCYEAAEQIPYSHPSLLKLVTLIDLTLNSSRFPKIKGTGDMQTDPELRYQKLGETLRDWGSNSSPDEDSAKFVNFQTFAARIDQRGLSQGPDAAILIIKDAFEDGRGTTEEERNAYIKAASQWLLIQGNTLYQEVTNGKVSSSQWRDWHKQLKAVATGKADKKTGSYHQDTTQLADQAAVAMEAVEQQKTG